MLTAEQKSFYDTFGFLVFPRLFSPEETSEISRLFEEVIEEARQGKSFTGEKRQMVLPYAAKDNVYGPDFLTTGGSRRQAMVRQLVEWGFK